MVDGKTATLFANFVYIFCRPDNQMIIKVLSFSSRFVSQIFKALPHTHPHRQTPFTFSEVLSVHVKPVAFCFLFFFKTRLRIKKNVMIFFAINSTQYLQSLGDLYTQSPSRTGIISRPELAMCHLELLKLGRYFLIQFDSIPP